MGLSYKAFIMLGYSPLIPILLPMLLTSLIMFFFQSFEWFCNGYFKIFAKFDIWWLSQAISFVCSFFLVYGSDFSVSLHIS